MAADTWRIVHGMNPRTLTSYWTVKRGDEFLRMSGRFTTIRRFRTEAGAQRTCDKANAAHGVAPAAPAQSRLVHVGWVCRDDLGQLLQAGSATVYQEQQEFRLLAPQPQYRVLVEPADDASSAVLVAHGVEVPPHV